MKPVFFSTISRIMLTALAGCLFLRDAAGQDMISFYEVPLTCGSAPDIGCGSRIKPLFMDTEKQEGIREAWVNRKGTIIAIVWDSSATPQQRQEKKITRLFKKHHITAAPILEENRRKEINGSFGTRENWYEGMEVDRLSIEEAGVIAENAVQFFREQKLLDETEADQIRNDLEAYMRTELVKVRTESELRHRKTQEEWHRQAYAIFVKHIGPERADQLSHRYYGDVGEKEKTSCCKGEKKCKHPGGCNGK